MLFMDKHEVKSIHIYRFLPKLLLGVVFGAFFIYGSTKRVTPPADPVAPITTSSDTAPVVYVENLHRYFAPTCFPADLSIFTRPTNAITPSLWRRHSVSDDFQVAIDDYIAGACGVVTTQPWGIDNLETIEKTYRTFALFYATNSLIAGMSEFWTVTNGYSKTFVWKDAAFQRDTVQPVSFALTLYNWGDIDFTYGETIPPDGFSSFVKLGGETVDMTAHVAPMRTVRLEKNLNQDTEWWLENYPEICHTNRAGELVFEYDTNEWYFVEFRFGYDEAVAAYERDLLEYEQLHSLAYKSTHSRSEESIQKNKKIIDEFDKHRISKYYAWRIDDGDKGGFEWAKNVQKQIDEMMFEEPTNMFLNIEIVRDEHLIMHPGLTNMLNKIEPAGSTNSNTTLYYEIVKFDSSKLDEILLSTIGEKPKLQNYIAFSQQSGDTSKGQKNSISFYVDLPHNSGVYISDRFMRQQDQIVDVASKNRSVTYVYPFRAGLVYKAHTTTPHYKFTDLTGQCKTWRSLYNHTDFYFTRKIGLKLKGAAFNNLKNYTKVEAEITPPVSMGAYSWKTSDNLRIISSGANYAGIAWNDGNAGFIRCVWDNGDPGEWKYCVTNTEHIAGVSNFNSYTQYLHLAASPKNVVFYAPHLDKNGVLKEAGTTNITLTCSYGGTQPGRLELSRGFGSRAILTRDGTICTLPTSWEVNGPAEKTFVVTGLASGDAETFALKYTGATVSDGYETTATVTATSVEVEADRTWPEMRKRRVFGPGEPFTITVNDSTELKRTASVIPGDYTEIIPLDGFSLPVTYSVIPPSGCIGIKARVMSDDDWIEAGYSNALSIGEIGAGLYVELKLIPDYVSFQGLKVMEGECAAQNIQGYYSSFDMSQVRHNTSNGAWRQTTVEDGNLAGFDRAGNAKTISELPPPWDIGGYEWHIPFYWSADNFTTTNRFTTNIQKFRLYPDGDFSVCKFGWTAHRSTNGVQNVIKE